MHIITAQKASHACLYRIPAGFCQLLSENQVTTYKYQLLRFTIAVEIPRQNNDLIRPHISQILPYTKTTFVLNFENTACTVHVGCSSCGGTLSQL